MNPQAMTESHSSFKRIGLFDSGVGGLSVLKELIAVPSNQDRQFFYFGDTARCPYGNRDAAEIAIFVEEIVTFLLSQSVDSIIMACNTSAACGLDIARSTSSVPVFDLISLTAKYVAQFQRKIGVMATASTVRSLLFSKMVHEIDSGLEVFELACPQLVPIIESGEIDHPSTKEVLQQYVRTLKAEKVEVVILGCTHFPFIKAQLEPILGEGVMIVNPAEILRDFLAQGNDQPGKGTDEVNFFVSGNPASFAAAAEKCFGALNGSVVSVDVASTPEKLLMNRLSDVLSGADNVPSHAVASPATSP